MARRSTIEILEKELVKRLDSLNNKVFSVKDFRSVYHSLAEEFDFPAVLSFKRFCQYFVKLGLLEEVKLIFPWRTFIRYIWGKAGSHLEVIATLDNAGYFSHYTAVDLHGLTLQNPKKVYFNVEQSPKPQGQGLSQASIDSGL